MADDDDKDNTDKNKDENVIRIPSLAERDRMRKAGNGKNNGSGSNGTGSNGSGGHGLDPEKIWRDQYRKEQKANKQPFFNLPPTTKYLAGSLVLVHIIMFFLPVNLQDWVIYHLSFIPARFTGDLPFEIFTVLTPFTYMWLHGGITHLLLNTVMMVAFGAGIERWLGGRRLLLMFLLCGLFGLVFHFLFYPGSTTPVIGASGGISGFFAVILVMINNGRWRGGPGNMGGGILPFAILWIVISVMSAFFSGIGGGAIAWAVHIGGFLGGFLLMKPYLRK